VLLIEGGAGSYRAGIFAPYMELLGLSDKSFVITDTRKIDPQSHNYNWDLMKYFENYSTLIYFVQP
jgi:hypothetical protein